METFTCLLLQSFLSLFFFTGTVWSWGDGDYGKLGHGGSDGTKTPKIIDTLQSLGVVRVFCGSQFSVALTRDGQVLTWCVQLYDCQFYLKCHAYWF